jgi:CRP/FNR family cyclic AMP-dependent transcriptional regulator
MDLFLEMFKGHPVLSVAEGETLIEQDTRTGRLFILIEGKVEVLKNGDVVAWSSQPGDILGDISALLDLPHTTTVRAVRGCRFYVFENAREFLERNPQVCVHLCELLARRLVSVTTYLAEIKRQYAGHDHIGMIDEVLDKLMHRTPRSRVPSKPSEVDEL